MNPEMRELVLNWLAKAESDLKIGRDELNTQKPATDMICFHMQQCVEKYLKAYLALNQTPFRRTHDIAELIEKCKDLDPEFEHLYQMKADELTIYGVDIRYPDDFYFPTHEEAEQALRITLSVRNFLREGLKKAGLEL